MTKRSLLLTIITLLILLTGTASVEAQDPVPEATVNGLFFYSPTCPHCHTVMDEVFPPLFTQYGSDENGSGGAFQVSYVNVQEPEGARLIYDACSVYFIPQDRCGGVPMMIVGSEVMFGSQEIPARLPGLIESGLASGGTPLPNVPGIEAFAGSDASSTQGMLDKFGNDLFANSLALVVLIALLLSVGLILYVAIQRLSNDKAKLDLQMSWFVLFSTTLLGLFIAATLVVEQEGISGTFILALALAGMMTLSAMLIWEKREDAQNGPALRLPNWLFPALAIAGLLVAGYLMYVEVGDNEAVCGAVGNCNAVQESAYSDLFGVLPIGLLGVIGYVAILGAWGMSQNASTARLGNQALFGLTLFGSAFSIYLTFLEPFVIGATCAWCLTSAIIMLMLLWLQAPEGLAALTSDKNSKGKANYGKKRRKMKHS